MKTKAQMINGQYRGLVLINGVVIAATLATFTNRNAAAVAAVSLRRAI
jgi:hypothetical protein